MANGSSYKYGTQQGRSGSEPSRAVWLSSLCLGNVLFITRLMGLCACAAYYRGAMGIVVVYDVTDEASFNNIRNWMRNIEQHASETNSNKVCQDSSACGRRVAWPVVVHG